ncbi:phage major capsid protein [Glaciihabitans sp. UYNi722]|uniref:phage major capsid protein n=1 Tax=Glaciihabitans sp. UYNi722 TaxID=3156344 RepID=UPI003395B3C7
MPSKLMEAKTKVHELSTKALETVEDPKLTTADIKKALDLLEPEIKTWTEEVQSLESIEDKRKQFMAGAGNPLDDAAGAVEGFKSIGQQFVDSANYKGMVAKGIKGNFTSGEVEVKTTLTEGTAGTPGGGYSPVAAVPTLVPGIVDIKFRPLTISDLFPGGVTSTPLIRYLVETSVTNAAAAVAETNLKPESAIAFSKVDEVLHKLATFLPISDEMLEDWAQAQSYIDARLILFIKLAEEAQLLSGDGTGANLVGILNRPGLAAPVVKGTAPSVVADNDMDAIYRQITAIRTTQFLEPDAIVIDPLAWQTVLLSKNSQGAYYANGPFADAQNPSLWSKKVAITPAIAANTALVGAFAQGGQVFRKGGITVEASNSHADYFQRNLTAIRAEERLALAIYRPGAFGVVSGL